MRGHKFTDSEIAECSKSSDGPDEYDEVRLGLDPGVDEIYLSVGDLEFLLKFAKGKVNE